MSNHFLLVQLEMSSDLGNMFLNTERCYERWIIALLTRYKPGDPAVGQQYQDNQVHLTCVVLF